jgi:outer membrane receptor protein involved in Fe transport
MNAISNTFVNKVIILAIVILKFSLVLNAHNAGNIKGKITETNSKTAIIGVNIYLKETIIGTSSDINGNYEFKNIQIGTYIIVFSLIGYKSIEKTVEVKENETTELNIEMEEMINEISEIVVQSEIPRTAASSGQISKIDIKLKPTRSTQDMLQLVPGLIIAQHAGGGKAEQIYIRGFDCDHGTDISINVDGMPVNMVTHGHGQGYADLHFLIAETVDDIEVNKGPYMAKFGDFATAGSVTFKTKDIIDNNILKVEAGDFNSQKYTLMYQIENGGAEQNAYIATQYYKTDGPFESPQQLERFNVFGKYFSNISKNSKLTVSAGGYSSSWNASGQIPERAIKQGIITRFDGIDNIEGGITGRQNLSLDYKFKTNDGSELDIQSYASHYNFKLFSNFTLFLTDSINGDMIEQVDNRYLFGLNTKYKFVSNFGKISVINRIGGGHRSDNINAQLWHSPDRNRMDVFTNDDIVERNFFAWAEQEYLFSSKFRLIAGVRHDYFSFDKYDNVGNALDTINNGLPHTSGVSQKSVFSPKLSLIIKPFKNTDVYLNFGRGFHSNDARDIVIGQKVNELVKIWKEKGYTSQEIATMLNSYNFDIAQYNSNAIPQATGAELGFRFKFFNKLHIGIASWYLHLAEEYVYVGDGGTTELSNATQRVGLDFDTRYSPYTWLWFDADVCYSNGIILDVAKSENKIPLAPKLTASGGISVSHKSGFDATLRLRHVGSRPANEDNSVVALGYTIFNSSISYQWKKLKFSVNLENILNSDWNEAQFSTETRLNGEENSVEELCFTPGNPRNIQFGIAYAFDKRNK